MVVEVCCDLRDRIEQLKGAANIATADSTASRAAKRPASGGKASASHSPPLTPDRRYIVVRGRLWRAANPDLPTELRDRLVSELMTARRAVAQARRAADRDAEGAAHAAVDAAKVALGERGPPWWKDGAPDLNRRMARTTPYAQWFEALAEPQRDNASDPA